MSFPHLSHQPSNPATPLSLQDAKFVQKDKEIPEENK